MIYRSARALHAISDTELSVQAAHAAAKQGLGGRSSNLLVTVMMRPRRAWPFWWQMRATDVVDRATLEVTVANMPGAWGGFDVREFRQASARLKVPLPDMSREPGLLGSVRPRRKEPEHYRVRYRLALENGRATFEVSGELVVPAAHPDDDNRGEGLGGL